MKNIRVSTLIGFLIVLVGLLYPIPSLTRGEVTVPISLDQTTVIPMSGTADLLAGTANFHASVSGLRSFATSQVAWGLLIISVGTAFLALQRTYSNQKKQSNSLYLSTGLILLGVAPGAVMRAVDMAALAGHQIPGELAVRSQAQLSLLISVVGLFVLFNGLRKQESSS